MVKRVLAWLGKFLVKPVPKYLSGKGRKKG
jgi:hypothetical protein